MNTNDKIKFLGLDDLNIGKQLYNPEKGFKVGELVEIKDEDSLRLVLFGFSRKAWEEKSHPYYSHLDLDLLFKMLRYSEEYVTIESIEYSQVKIGKFIYRVRLYKIKEDNGSFHWVDNCFKPFPLKITKSI